MTEKRAPWLMHLVLLLMMFRRMLLAMKKKASMIARLRERPSTPWWSKLRTSREMPSSPNFTMRSRRWPISSFSAAPHQLWGRTETKSDKRWEVQTATRHWAKGTHWPGKTNWATRSLETIRCRPLKKMLGIWRGNFSRPVLSWSLSSNSSCRQLFKSFWTSADWRHNWSYWARTRGLLTERPRAQELLRVPWPRLWLMLP